MRRARIALVFLAAVLLCMASFHALASAAPIVTAHVAGQAIGVLPAPCNCEVGVIVAANAMGSTSSLEGEGTNHATSGVTNHFSLIGSIDGSVVSLFGVVSRSTFPPLEGSPVEIQADADTGVLKFTLVPFAGGPFAGQTVVFSRSANVLVTGE